MNTLDNCCSGCLQPIPGRTFLTCSTCNEKYDLDCANVSIQRFRNTMTIEHKKSWICDSCFCKKPKKGNTNTPLRQQKTTPPPTKQNLKVNLEEQHNNVTLRGKPIQTVCAGEGSDEDTICSGDTLPPENCFATSSQNTMITEIENILEKKLEESKKAIIMEMRKTITTEISNTIAILKQEVKQELKEEIKRAVTIVSDEQEKVKQDLLNLNKHIAELKTENKKLQSEIEDIEKKLEKSNTNPAITKSNTKELMYTDNQKKLVLYGLKSHEWETENELYDRVINVFHEIMNINLEGYIDDLRRMGKKGPIELTLISKQWTKYLVQNSHYFNSTGLGISEYLDDTAREKRREMIKILIEARKNGHQANIKNNKLIINGTQYKKEEEFNCNNKNATNYRQQYADVTSGNSNTDGQRRRQTDMPNKPGNNFFHQRQANLHYQ